VRAHLNWKRAVETVLEGINLLAPMHQNAIILQLCAGTAETAYHVAVQQMLLVHHAQQSKLKLPYLLEQQFQLRVETQLSQHTWRFHQC
jgi:hypothetical protein